MAWLERGVDTFATVPAERAAAHIRRLCNAGMTYTAIAQEAGLARTMLHAVVRGTQQVVRLDVLDKLAAIPTPPRPAAPSTEWESDAACLGLDPAIFYPEIDGTRYSDDDPAWDQPRAICAGCEVVEECRDYALAACERHGMWGGMTSNQRRAWLRHRREGAP